MPNINVITIAGHLGGDPKVSEVGEKKTMKAVFSVGQELGWGDNKHTSWHRVVAWGKQAEIIAQYFKKGSGIMVVGEQDNYTYEVNGEKKYAHEIRLEKFSFTDKKPTASGSTSGGQDDDLPY